MAGCSSNPSVHDPARTVESANKIECALRGAKLFLTECEIERGPGAVLTMRHHDGGFRKLKIDTDATIDTADGADGVRIQTTTDGRSEVTIGEDRYRLPAKL